MLVQYLSTCSECGILTFNFRLYPFKVFLGCDVLHLSRFCACWSATISSRRWSKIQFLLTQWGVRAGAATASWFCSYKIKWPYNPINCKSLPRSPSFCLLLITVLHRHGYRSLCFTTAADFSMTDGPRVTDGCGSKHLRVLWHWSQHRKRPDIPGLGGDFRPLPQTSVLGPYSPTVVWEVLREVL